MEPATFRYMPDDDHGGRGGEDDEETGGGCFLDIYAHEARDVHNICIYGEQDVYARFSLTSGGGGADRSTRAAVAAGASPSFEERLRPLRLRRSGGESLKCELWMRSCDARLLEDQLLGFALVPLAAVAAAPGARLDARDFALSSTELFHSPAGSVRLSLALRSGSGAGAGAGADAEAAAGLELSSSSPAPVDEDDYSRVEFPDLNVARENLDMAAQYLPFFHLGAAAMDEDLEKPAAACSMDGSKNASASTTTTASDDRGISISAAPVCRASPEPDTPTSSGGKVAPAGKEEEKGGGVFEFPLGDIDMGAEQSAMQRQIMEMYVKSMQQFTESLGRMKLPMELDGAGGVVQNEEKLPAPEAEPKKDGARVFYGSRAFF